MVAPIRDIGNKSLFTSVIMNLHSRMDFLPNMGMDVNDFGSSNVNNYNNVRGYTMTSNKTASRTVSMSLSEALVDYATKIEHLNNIPDNIETRDPINSL